MDVCQAHSGMEERIKNIDEKCDTIISELRATANGIWQRVNQHIDESPVVRGKVNELDTELRIIKSDLEKKERERDKKESSGQWKIGLIVGTVIALVQIAASYFK